MPFCNNIPQPLASERRHVAVSRTASVLAIFWPLSVVFRRKDQVHQIVHYILCKNSLICCGLTVLVCCCAANQYSKIGVFFQIFQKTVRVLRVSDTKHPCRNAFIVNLFALESRKESRNEERALSGTPRRVPTCLLTLSLRTTLFGGFPDYFCFSHFLATFC